MSAAVIGLACGLVCAAVFLERGPGLTAAQVAVAVAGAATGVVVVLVRRRIR